MKHDSFTFDFAHLYRKYLTIVVWAVFTTIVVGSFIQTAHAQSKKQTGPRALGVIAWSGNSENPDPVTSVLDPIAIYVENRFYDASIYQAQPQPLAVDSGVVYDVLKSGELIGTFTLGRPREQDGMWYGIGRYEAKGAVVAKVAPSPPPAKSNAEPEDERPHLRRGTPPPPAPKEQTDVVLKNIDRDPERPTLRRHTAADAKKPAAAPEPSLIVPPTHMLPAISTETGPEYRSFQYHAKAGEADQMRAAIEKLAQSELDKARTESPAVQRAEENKPGGKIERFHRTRPWPPVDLQNVRFGVYDVNSDNAPILVYSATAILDGTKKYVTIAAWEEIDQSLRKVFAQITDDHHLDVYPRLEIIDAVDARGNERGELLFRAFGDQGSRFVLYHPGPDSLELLFDSARGAR